MTPDERRAEVARMTRKHMTIPQIAAVLGVSNWTVSDDRKRVGSPGFLRAGPSSRLPAIVAIHLKLTAEGARGEVIAEACGYSTQESYRAALTRARRAGLLPRLRETPVPGQHRVALVWSDDSWRNSARCAGLRLSTFFGDAEATERAKAICEGVGDTPACPVREQCLAFALKNGEFGVWAGTTDAERVKMKAAA